VSDIEHFKYFNENKLKIITTMYCMVLVFVYIFAIHISMQNKVQF